ncbi:hypothetical protein [Thalassovita mangrovi]|uniref:Uncharacterized protein n=1 Tax=Thalassovita mangrovi TaxID=2692236 RepID=A0A6L8LGA8_9RHOB|nr:hypothetical protein [Thalassovita mangrovi]MYM55137.1 hypothetical protein [Thalassovita mangrovi]
MSELFTSIEHPIVTQVNKIKYLLTKQIRPINDRILEVDIAAAISNEETTSMGGIDGVHALTITPQSEAFRLSFEGFVSYAVTEEMFTQESDEEVSIGGWLRIYSKSFFLDFVKRSTWAESYYDTVLIHYQINTLDHTIDIVTSSAPEILKL